VSEAARTFCHTCHHVDGWSGFPRSERNSLPSGATPNVSMCARRSSTSSGGIGTFRTGLRALGPGLPLVRPFSPRCSWTWPSSVYAFPGAGLESPKIR